MTMGSPAKHILCFPILHILHIFRNVMLAMEVSFWPMVSGFGELVARFLMGKVLIRYIAADALFLAEPSAWLGAMLCVFLPYFFYIKKLSEKHI